MGLFSKSGSKKGDAPARFLTAGNEVSCPQCHGNLFLEGKAQLNTAAMSLANLDWANKSATTLICAQCSFISWYSEAPSRFDG
jgi:predicted nucleic-acid-binding Zn-ribbon protein